MSLVCSTQWPVWTFKNRLNYKIVLFQALQWLLKSLREKKSSRTKKTSRRKPKPFPTTIFLMSLPDSVLPESIAGELSSLNWPDTLDLVCLHLFITEAFPDHSAKQTLLNHSFLFLSFALYFLTSFVTMLPTNSLLIYKSVLKIAALWRKPLSYVCMNI